MKSKLKLLPKFKDEDEERKFWAKANLARYFDFSKPVKFDLSALEPSSKTITLRVPETLLYSLRRLAHKKAVPYQSLMKVYLTEKVGAEFTQTAR